MVEIAPKPVRGEVSRNVQGAIQIVDSQDVQVTNWLLEEAQPSVRYHALVDLLDRKADDPDVKAALSTIRRVGWARDLLRTQKPTGYWEAHEPRTVGRRGAGTVPPASPGPSTAGKLWPRSRRFRRRIGPPRWSGRSREARSSISSGSSSRRGDGTLLGSGSTTRRTITTTCW